MVNTMPTIAVNPEVFERFDGARWSSQMDSNTLLTELMNKAGLPSAAQFKELRKQFEIKKGSEQEAVPAEAC